MMSLPSPSGAIGPRAFVAARWILLAVLGATGCFDGFTNGPPTSSTTASSPGTGGAQGGSGGEATAGAGVGGGAGGCTPGTTQACYTGPEGTLGVGMCRAGVRTCDANGTFSGPCYGDVVPHPESCYTPGDDDCNGAANEGGLGCVCTPNAVVSCYTGPAGTAGVGACRTGKRTCNALGSQLGPCVGEVTPKPESCATAEDDDCNGLTNESGSDCNCVPSSTASCYSGPAGTAGVGACKAGLRACAADGQGYGPCIGEVVPAPETCFDAVDNDCNGQTNEGGPGCACVPNAIVPCYTGPTGTAGVGICKAGTATCNALGTALGPCTGEVLPAAENCFNGVDDNCDGQTNENCNCNVGDTVSCYTGPAGTQGVGICAPGTRSCDGATHTYGPCVGEVLPAAETCLDAVDNNCNGQINESGQGCVCLPGSTAPCYTGPTGTVGVGACKAGLKTCNNLGTAYGACTGEVLPSPETCVDLIDNDCNGQTNEGGQGCVCVPGSTRACYNGPAGTAGIGACKSGLETCNVQGIGYGLCVGEVTPQAETCNTPVDDDCNGQTNEGGPGCVCTPNATRPCYSGPAGTQGVGPCVGGTQACNGLGTAWGACAGEVTPQPESCNTPIDDNCNGQVNEGGVGCVCTPNTTTTCYSGAAGTIGVGPCQSGLSTCNALGNAAGPCVGEVTPQPETCNTPIDDNCNGQINEGGVGCVCTPNSSGACYSGPAGTAGVGPCKAGTGSCNTQGTAYLACVGQVTPGVESCNDLSDADCTGVINDSCAAPLWGFAPGTAPDDEGFNVAVDPQGNILHGAYYMGTIDVGCGPLVSPGSGETALLWKTTPSGQCIWSLIYGDDTAVRGLATDPQGNIYVTSFYLNDIDFPGVSVTSAGGVDIYVAKFDTNGVFKWARSYGDAQGQSSVALAVDSKGNVIVIGYYSGTIDIGGGLLTSAGALDILLFKLDTNGNHVWSKRFGDSNVQLGNAVAVDAQDNIIITGTMINTTNFGGQTLVSGGLGDVFVAKFAPNGTHTWSQRWGDIGDQRGNGLATDLAGNIYLTGSYGGTLDFGNGTGAITTKGGTDAFLVKFSPGGVAQWAKGLGGPNAQTGVSVAVDSLGNVGLTGALDGSADFGGGTLTSVAGSDTYVAKYTSAGVHLWSRSFGGPANQVPRAIAVDKGNNWWVSGFETGPMTFGASTVVGGGGEDLYVLKIAP